MKRHFFSFIASAGDKEYRGPNQQFGAPGLICVWTPAVLPTIASAPRSVQVSVQITFLVLLRKQSNLADSTKGTQNSQGSVNLTCRSFSPRNPNCQEACCVQSSLENSVPYRRPGASNGAPTETCPVQDQAPPAVRPPWAATPAVGIPPPPLKGAQRPRVLSLKHWSF